jgi:SAM-dependent methyltransferase
LTTSDEVSAGTDPRAATAAYYDLAPDFPRDIPFYLEQVPSPASVLELGCGTGRVTVPLARRASFLHGVDLSAAMVDRCRRQLSQAGIAPSRAVATVGDITRLDLQREFDCIIGPYRVFQNLATDAEVAGLFATVRSHLARGGQCMLNAFMPLADPATVIDRWQTPGEDLDWELPVEGGVVRCYVRRAGVRTQPLVLLPELIYRRYRDSRLEAEAVSSIAMRCWYPDELQHRIHQEGFEVTGRWGGYEGEQWGNGPELIIAFSRS